MQHIRDKLAVDAYETHGRIAIEVSDLAEFRQCHAVLKQLYRDGVRRAVHSVIATSTMASYHSAPCIHTTICLAVLSNFCLR